MDGRRLGGGLRHQVLGVTTTSPSTTPGTSRRTPAAPTSGKIDLKELVDEVVAARHRPAAADPLHGRAQEPHRRAERGLPPRHRRVRLQGRVQGRLPDQGQPAPLRRRGDRRSSGGPTTTASRPAPSPSCWPSWRMLDDEEALIICNGYKDEEYIETALMASKLGRTVIIVVEKLSELPLIAETRQEDRRAAAHRHPRQAGGQGLGALGGVGRRPLEVRPVDARGGRGDQLPARRTTCSSCFELLHFHLGSQISAIRAVKNALREAGRFYVEVVQAGRAAQVPRRRRRPGRRLRRLADQLRVVDELHHAGVRERHRVRAAGDLRRGRACRTRRSSPSRGARSSRTTRCW